MGEQPGQLSDLARSHLKIKNRGLGMQLRAKALDPIPSNAKGKKVHNSSPSQPTHFAVKEDTECLFRVCVCSPRLPRASWGMDELIAS